jgi:hypothetical protein
MAKINYKVNDFVTILKYKNDPINKEGRITVVYESGHVHVSNLNMPFCGSVNRIFRPDEIAPVTNID